MNRIAIFLLFMLASFSIAFSATSEEPDQAPDVRVIVQLWKDIQEYVDTHEFGYWYTNDHHVEYIIENILKNYGIIGTDEYFVVVMGIIDTGRPYVLIVVVNYKGEEYSKNFIIKHIKPKGGCEGDPGKCA